MLFTIQSFAPPPPMLFSSPAVVVFSPAGRRFPMLLSPGPRHAFSQQAQVNTPHGPGRHQPPGRRPAPDRSAHRSLLIEALIAWSMPPTGVRRPRSASSPTPPGSHRIPSRQCHLCWLFRLAVDVHSGVDLPDRFCKKKNRYNVFVVRLCHHPSLLGDF